MAIAVGSGRTSGDLPGVCLNLWKLLITCCKSENYSTSLKCSGAVVKGSVWRLMIQLSTTPGIPQQQWALIKNKCQHHHPPSSPPPPHHPPPNHMHQHTRFPMHLFPKPCSTTGLCLLWPGSTLGYCQDPRPANWLLTHIPKVRKVQSFVNIETSNIWHYHFNICSKSATWKQL